MINDFIDLLKAVDELDQVGCVNALGGQWVGSDLAVDEQFHDLVGGRMHPVLLPENHQYDDASIVVQKKDSNHVFIEMFPVFKADAFILSVRSKDYLSLVNLCERVTQKAARYTSADHAGAMLITGTAVDYEETVMSYRADFELIVSHLSSTTQALPAAFVYEQSTHASADKSGNRVRQLESVTMSVLIISRAEELDAVRQSIKTALLGKTAGGDGEEIHLAGGQRVDVIGPMHVWKESFSIDQHWRS